VSSDLLVSFVNDFNVMKRALAAMRYHKLVRGGDDKHFFTGQTKEDIIKEIKQLTTGTNQNDLHYQCDAILWRAYNKS
jgi:hypothetical protein